jgi:ferritin-like metal-binding protein YciE
LIGQRDILELLQENLQQEEQTAQRVEKAIASLLHAATVAEPALAT